MEGDLGKSGSADADGTVPQVTRIRSSIAATPRKKMPAAIHPARTMEFDDLMAGLDARRAAGTVYRKFHPETGLALYVYSPRCVYEDGWDAYTTVARGLVLHPEGRRVVATPFPKFFNVGERHGDVPDLPFEAYEKLDGSLVVVFHHGGGWMAATKGAFDSAQAAWAQARLDAADLSALEPGTTYLFEAVYPENKIVVRYDEPALVMLGAYDAAGRELSYDEIQDACARLGWRAARRHAFSTVAEMVAHARTLPATHEGFVLRFANGLRLKIKGDEYRRIHALISRCTPLAMWEAMAAGDDLQAIRRDLPEEFWGDFDDIVRSLDARVDAVTARVAGFAASVAHLTDKELGLALPGLPADARGFLFAWRKAGGRIDGKARASLLRDIRPTGNDLPGYVPSYSMGHVLDEAASG